MLEGFRVRFRRRSSFQKLHGCAKCRILDGRRLKTCLTSWLSESTTPPKPRTADPSLRERLDQLKRWAEEGPVTLLYAANTGERNHARVLKETLETLPSEPS
jgi:hypothetical protein